VGEGESTEETDVGGWTGEFGEGVVESDLVEGVGMKQTARATL
jgi:hypothetical protein